MYYSSKQQNQLIYGINIENDTKISQSVWRSGVRFPTLPDSERRIEHRTLSDSTPLIFRLQFFSVRYLTAHATLTGC